MFKSMIGLDELLPNVIQSFEFDDEDLPTLEPYEFDFNEELSQPYSLHLSLVAKDPSVDESKLVGHACTLTLTRGGLVRHINGLVREAVFSGIAVDAFTPLGSLPTGLLHLTIVPGLSMLGQRKNNRIFQDLKVTDILKKVLEEALGDYGRKVTIKTSKEYQELEYCTQYNETDLEFVQRLMASEGIMSYFKQGEKAEELVLFDDSDTYLELVTMDHGKVPFETGVVESQVLETIRRFRVDTRQMQTTVSVRNFNWSKGGAPDDSATQGKDSLERDREWYEGEAPVGLRALGGDGVYAKTSAQNQAKLMQETARFSHSPRPWRRGRHRADSRGGIRIRQFPSGRAQPEVPRTKANHLGGGRATQEAHLRRNVGEVMYRIPSTALPTKSSFGSQPFSPLHCRRCRRPWWWVTKTSPPMFTAASRCSSTGTDRGRTTSTRPAGCGWPRRQPAWASGASSFPGRGRRSSSPSSRETQTSPSSSAPCTTASTPRRTRFPTRRLGASFARAAPQTATGTMRSASRTRRTRSSSTFRHRRT